jgi:hypothetical protein
MNKKQQQAVQEFDAIGIPDFNINNFNRLRRIPFTADDLIRLRLTEWALTELNAIRAIDLNERDYNDVRRIANRELFLEYFLHAYNNGSDDGAGGRAQEIEGRYYVTGVAAKSAPQGCTDIIVKQGVALESKTGSPWILDPFTHNETRAKQVLESDFIKMKSAMFVLYQPTFTPGSTPDAMVFTQKTFLDIMHEFDMLRVKEASGNRGYGIAIKQYKPTAGWTPRKGSYEAICEALTVGETLANFKNRMNV